MSTSEEILLRMRTAMNVENDNQLYKALNLSSNAVIPGWKKRDNVPMRWIEEVATRAGVKKEWLITGHGEQDDPDLVKGLPSLSAALYIAQTHKDGLNNLNTLLDSFIVEHLIQQLLHFRSMVLQNKNSFVDRAKKVLLNIGQGRYLMMLDEMLSKLQLINSSAQILNAKQMILNLVQGDNLHSLFTKPIFKENEKAAFQLWAESLTDEEAEFIILNINSFRKELSILIPKISKSHSDLDVTIMRKLTSLKI